MNERSKPKTYEAEINGRKVRVTIPGEDGQTQNDLVEGLRAIAVAIEEQGISVMFPTPECPFVDAAVEAIEHGGCAKPKDLASLVYYIADMLEE